MTDRPKILAVDDEPNILKLISLNLSLDGFEVYTAGDGPSAIALFDEIKPDLMLVDIMMPGMDGFEVVDIIRGHSRIPIIMLTARDDMPSIQRALANGADDYITKPFNLRLLSVRVKSKIKRIEMIQPGAK
ncbi:MAG: response regulator [Dehalococcoidales bacterium]|nr:response regulator [Dehalococcoidales bacterium]